MTDLDPDQIKARHEVHRVDTLGNDECDECGRLWPCETYYLAVALLRTREWGEAQFHEAQALRAQLAAAQIRDTIRQTQAERDRQL